jgi:WXG100 family type VII secretion target
MADIIKMDYDLMQQMNQTFLRGVEQLQDTMQEMQSVANALEEGALQGRGGDAFTDAIRGQLCPAISRLTEKFQELSGDINVAMQAMQQADQSSEGMF